MWKAEAEVLPPLPVGFMLGLLLGLEEGDDVFL
jgi:hypothetical protein